MEIINGHIIPALDEIGTAFEEKRAYLPQLLMSAEAASLAFDVVKKGMKQAESDGTKKEFILATVKGDIHDIGKNIVKVILENYGYQVIDLGRDVDPETIVEKAVRENVRLIGLSALMTTTVGAMEDTIRALRESGHECRIMVGGAVLTEEYAGEIGADRFVRDAKASADTAKEILG
jgi:5-methyltetrahydrofolate--homocysteine methyltransferase